jgi:hypothetical protein
MTKAIQQLAATFLDRYIRETGAELVQVFCHIDKRKSEAANETEIQAFVAQLQEPQRYDDTEDEVELQSDIVEEPEPVKPIGLILAKQGRNAMKYFVGFRQQRAVFSFDARLAHVFAGENEIVATVFDAGLELTL